MSTDADKWEAALHAMAQVKDKLMAAQEEADKAKAKAKDWEKEWNLELSARADAEANVVVLKDLCRDLYRALKVHHQMPGYSEIMARVEEALGTSKKKPRSCPRCDETNVYEINNCRRADCGVEGYL